MPVDPIFLNEVGLEKADSSSPPPRLPCPRAQSLLRLAALSRLQSPASGCHCLLLLLLRSSLVVGTFPPSQSTISSQNRFAAVVKHSWKRHKINARVTPKCQHRSYPYGYRVRHLNRSSVEVTFFSICLFRGVPFERRCRAAWERRGRWRSGLP